MLQPSDLQLNHVRQEISRKVAFPEELANIIDEASGRDLLDEIAVCRTADERMTLAYSLSRKRLNDLFGAVLTISAAAGEELFGHLLDIFRLRATLSLTHTAWAYYQRQYPNDRLGRVLSTLVKALPDKESNPTFVSELKEVTIDYLLPHRLADRLHGPAAKAAAQLFFAEGTGEQTADEPVQDDSIPVARLREKFPLLAAYTSLATLPDEAKSSSALSSRLCTYMIRLSILPDTAFAAVFMTAWFQDAKDPDLLLNAGLYIQALRISKRPAQLSLLRRFLNDYRLSKNWSQINQAILEMYGVPQLQQDAPAQEQAPPEQKQKNPFVQTSGSRPGEGHPSQPLPAAGQAMPNKPADGHEQQQADTFNDNGNAGRQKGLLGWLRGRRDKPAKPDDPPVQPNGLAGQAGPNGLPEQPAAVPPPAPVPQQPPEKEKRLAEQEQTLLAGLRQPDLLADLPQTAAADSIWLQLDSNCALRFRQWAFMNQIGLHDEDERKMRFLQRYALQIRGVRSWDAQTLLIELDGFYLVSHQDEESCLWYYDHNTISMLAESGRNPPLNQPEQPMINSREAMLQDTISNIVRLPLDAVNLLFAHDFIQRVRENRKNKA